MTENHTVETTEIRAVVTCENLHYGEPNVADDALAGLIYQFTARLSEEGYFVLMKTLPLPGGSRLVYYNVSGMQEPETEGDAPMMKHVVTIVFSPTGAQLFGDPEIGPKIYGWLDELSTEAGMAG